MVSRICRARRHVMEWICGMVLGGHDDDDSGEYAEVICAGSTQAAPLGGLLLPHGE